MHFIDVTFYFFSKNYQRKNAGLCMEINGGDNNGVFLHDLRGDSFGVKPNELFMDINGGDKNGIFLHDLIKITEGTVSEGTIFMHIIQTKLDMQIWKIRKIIHFLSSFLSSFSSSSEDSSSSSLVGYS